MSLVTSLAYGNAPHDLNKNTSQYLPNPHRCNNRVVFRYFRFCCQAIPDGVQKHRRGEMYRLASGRTRYGARQGLARCSLTVRKVTPCQKICSCFGKGGAL
jgi:hypothetical protein